MSAWHKINCQCVDLGIIPHLYWLEHHIECRVL
jgi:hypothetical protein